MNRIIFTLCSNNYLAHAKTLGDSILEYVPNTRFVIGLVDKLDPLIKYDIEISHEILPYDSLDNPAFEEMRSRYNIIEFNTAVKPYYFEYFFSKTDEGDLVYYIDPDIAFYGDLTELDDVLKNNNCVLTPHLTVADIRISAYETMIMNVGIYNLGFIGLKNTTHATSLLKWWQERVNKLGYIDYAKGLFVDQIWANLMPLLFTDVRITMSPAYNMAVWNLHERRLIRNNGKYYVNSLDTPLVFFHFSGFKPLDVKYLGKIKTSEFTVESRPDLRELFEEYGKRLLANSYSKLSLIKPGIKFGELRFSSRERMGMSLRYRVDKLIRYFLRLS